MVSPELQKAGTHGHLKQTKTFSSEVVTKWLAMDLDLIRIPVPAGTGIQGGERILAYSGIALYEAVVNGMPAYRSLSGQLTDFPAMPTTEPGRAYHWAAAGNAALAATTRYLFDTASTSTNAQTKQMRLDKINALESSLHDQYAKEVDAATLQRSEDLGRSVAYLVNKWADGDGYKLQGGAYTPPAPTEAEPWLWVPTASTPPINPYVSRRRLLVPHSDNNADVTPLSTVNFAQQGSAFYELANEVYLKSKSPTDDQKNLALWFRDAGEPGYYGGSGHYLSILPTVISKSGVGLDVAAVAFAKSGIAMNDAFIVGFIKKYQYNIVRPITYIKKYIDPSWAPLIATPNHPEFPSAHSFHVGGFAAALAEVFGENFEFTDNTYAGLSTTLGILKPLTFHSFTLFINDIGDSLVYEGILYYPSTVEGIRLGEKVAANVLSTVKFLK
jgi:hypothetical protein